MNLEIKTYQYPLLDGLQKEVDQLSDKSFGLAAGKTPEQIAEGKIGHYSTPAECIMAFTDGQLIGVQKIYTRKISFGGEEIFVGGLGGLCVDKKYRGQGVASQLLFEAKNELGKLGCDIGLLFTDVGNPRYTKLYGQFGYVVLDREYSFIDKLGKMQKYKAAMISPIKSLEKFNLLINSNEIPHIGAGEF